MLQSQRETSSLYSIVNFSFFYLPSSHNCCRAPSQLLTADRSVCQEDSTAKLGAVMEGTPESKGAAGHCWQVGPLHMSFSLM